MRRLDTHDAQKDLIEKVTGIEEGKRLFLIRKGKGLFLIDEHTGEESGRWLVGVLRGET